MKNKIIMLTVSGHLCAIKISALSRLIVLIKYSAGCYYMYGWPTISEAMLEGRKPLPVLYTFPQHFLPLVMNSSSEDTVRVGGQSPRQGHESPEPRPCSCAVLWAGQGVGNQCCSCCLLTLNKSVPGKGMFYLS